MGAEILINIENKNKITNSKIHLELLKRKIKIWRYDQYKDSSNLSFDIDNHTDFMRLVDGTGYKENMTLHFNSDYASIRASGKVMDINSVKRFNKNIALVMNIIRSNVGIGAEDVPYIGFDLNIDQRHLIFMCYRKFEDIAPILQESIDKQLYVTLSVKELNKLVTTSATMCETVEGITFLWFIPRTQEEIYTQAFSLYGYNLNQLVEKKNKSPQLKLTRKKYG